jgi:hypothetical protein
VLVAGRLDQQRGVIRQQRPQAQVPQVKLRGQVHREGILGGDRAANPALSGVVGAPDGRTHTTAGVVDDADGTE